jgi:hypothetical protein
VEEISVVKADRRMSFFSGKPGDGTALVLAGYGIRQEKIEAAKYKRFIKHGDGTVHELCTNWVQEGTKTAETPEGVWLICLGLVVWACTASAPK